MIIKVHQEDERGNVIRTVCKNKIEWKGRSFVIPAGFESDGASVPRFFWRIVCPPTDPQAVRAGVAHDWIYRTQPKGWTRAEADKMFYDLLVEDGMYRCRARLAYLGVRLGGGFAWDENAAVKKTIEAVEEVSRQAADEAAKAHDDAYRREEAK